VKKSATKGQFGAMIRRVPVFQQAAVCLTKFGPESGEAAKGIFSSKRLGRRSGIRPHTNEFWWGIGEKGTAHRTTKVLKDVVGDDKKITTIKQEQMFRQRNCALINE
jgi:hypothetical protein